MVETSLQHTIILDSKFSILSRLHFIVELVYIFFKDLCMFSQESEELFHNLKKLERELRGESSNSCEKLTENISLSEVTIMSWIRGSARNFIRLELNYIGMLSERSDFFSVVIFGVAVKLRRFACSYAIFLRSSCLQCRAPLQSSAKFYCLLI